MALDTVHAEPEWGRENLGTMSPCGLRKLTGTHSQNSSIKWPYCRVLSIFCQLLFLPETRTRGTGPTVHSLFCKEELPRPLGAANDQWLLSRAGFYCVFLPGKLCFPYLCDWHILYSGLFVKDRSMSFTEILLRILIVMWFPVWTMQQRAQELLIRRQSWVNPPATRISNQEPTENVPIHPFYP